MHPKQNLIKSFDYIRFSIWLETAYIMKDIEVIGIEITESDILQLK